MTRETYTIEEAQTGCDRTTIEALSIEEAICKFAAIDYRLSEQIKSECDEDEMLLYHVYSVIDGQKELEEAFDLFDYV